MIVLIVCQIFVAAPKRYPDLWAVANCVFSCAHFIGFSVMFHLIQFTLVNDDLNEAKSDKNELKFDCCFTNSRQNPTKVNKLD